MNSSAKLDKQKKKKATLKSQLKETVSEWAQSSTSHGLPNIFRNSNLFLKLMWTVCLIASAGYCAYSVYRSIANYNQFNVITQLSDYPENPIDFPVVTYCNSNPFTTQYGLNYSKSFLANETITDLLNATLIESFFNHSDIQEIVNLYIARTVVSRAAMQLNDTEKQKMGYSMQMSLVMCAFGNQPCDPRSFVWHYESLYGNCFKFNTGADTQGNPFPKYQTLKTGKINGLFLILTAGTFSDAYTLGYESGMQLFIHNMSTAPSSVDSVALKPGSITYVAVKKIFTQKQPDPYNDCVDDLTVDKYDNIFYRKTFDSGYKYEQRNCLDLCAQSYMIDKCKCADAAYPTLNNVSYCKSVLDIICLYLRLVDFYKSSEFSQCYTYCPLECATLKFETKVSSTSFPHESLGSLMTNNKWNQDRFRYLNLTMSQANMEKALVGVYVYFDDNKYTLISQSPAQSLEDLMSNVGGILGLYIGVSFLSFVELFELFFQFIFLVIRHNSSQIATANQSNANKI